MKASENRTISSNMRSRPHRSRMATPATAKACATIAGQAPHTSTIENVKVMETKIAPDWRSGPRVGNGRTSASTASVQYSGGNWPTLPTADSDLSQAVHVIGSATTSTPAPYNMAPTAGYRLPRAPRLHIQPTTLRVEPAAIARSSDGRREPVP